LLAAAAAAGCKGDDDDEEAKCNLPGGARGTPECQRWQVAICDFGSSCGSLGQCDCIGQTSGIECVSDAEATRCADALKSATCSNTSELAGCDITEMANRAPAQAGCLQYLDTVCQADERCGGGDAATCVTLHNGTGTGQIDCTRAVALTLSFEKCLSELNALECGADFPSACEGSVLLG